MADNSIITEAQKDELTFARLAGQMRSCMPGVIKSFDPKTNRCTVQPGIKLKVTKGDKIEYQDMPEIPNVPLVVPSSGQGGFALTMPIKEGDTCMLNFSDRALDNFLQDGESVNPGDPTTELTSSPRSHHLSDAICTPGFIADPQVLPEWNNENIEFRDKDRKMFNTLGPDGLEMTDGQARQTMNEGNVNIESGESKLSLSENGITLTDGQATLSLSGGRCDISAPQGIAGTSLTAISLSTPGLLSLLGSNFGVGGPNNNINISNGIAALQMIGGLTYLTGPTGISISTAGELNMSAGKIKQTAALSLTLEGGQEVTISGNTVTINDTAISVEEGGQIRIIKIGRPTDRLILKGEEN